MGEGCLFPHEKVDDGTYPMYLLYLTSMTTYDKVVSASSSKTESRRRIGAEAKRRKEQAAQDHSER